MHRPAIALVCILVTITPAAASDAVIEQVFKRDEARWIEGDTATIERIVQSGKVKRYSEAMLADGVHFRTGTTSDLSADIVPGDYHSGGLIGVHGADTHIRFRGHWRGDEGGAYPMLVLRAGGRMTWTAEARVDFVMDPNFFTRQLWVWGDGTGTLELAPGFISDRTAGATVADAMGTIRLNGATLITHRSHSLPYNTRPDGRGGVYHNGHVVFEGSIPSTWSIRSEPQTYAAQVDFHTDGTLDCRAGLTHTGQIRVCLPVGNGGHFVSSGAFRTTAPAVTITKTGAGMLSLEGQQAYHPGARLIVTDGLLRLHSDPARSDRLGGDYGDHLNLEIGAGAALLISAPLVRLASLAVADGATVWILDGCDLQVAGDKAIADGATVVHGDR